MLPPPRGRVGYGGNLELLLLRETEALAERGLEPSTAGIFGELRNTSENCPLQNLAFWLELGRSQGHVEDGRT